MGGESGGRVAVRAERSARGFAVVFVVGGDAELV